MTFTDDVDPALLSLAERIAAVREIERDIARLHARQVRLVAAVADDSCAGAVCPELDREMVKEELRAALGESAVAVANRICLARALTGRLPVTLTALAAGEITLRHARLLAEAVLPLTDPDAAAVEAACVPFAAGRDLAAFARKVRREVLKLDSRSAEQQLDAALADRGVWAHADDPAGMGFLGAVLPAEGAQALLAALDLLADHTGPGDERTREQRRADALVQLGIDALNGYPTCPTCGTRTGSTGDGGPAGSRPRWHGLRPAVQVTVALSTLLGLDDQPGDLDGHGPIPAALARRLAADPTGTWRRLVTDPLGHLLDYGRTRYRPPADLRDFVIARDRTCRFPTCHRQARRCDLDHVIRWADGGATDEANLHCLCPRHHKAKDEAGWHAVLNPDRSVTWTSPTGQTYTVPAATYPIDGTAAMYARNDNSDDAATPAESGGQAA